MKDLHSQFWKFLVGCLTSQYEKGKHEYLPLVSMHCASEYTLKHQAGALRDEA